MGHVMNTGHSGAPPKQTWLTTRNSADQGTAADAKLQMCCSLPRKAEATSSSSWSLPHYDSATEKSR